MLTPETIANKTFRRTLLGYDLEQVDDFLDEIILHLQQLERERKEMSDTIDRLAAEIRRLTPDNGHQPEPEETVAFPMSPHGVVVSATSQEKAARVKEKKAKSPKAKPAEGERKPVKKDKPEKVKKPVKAKKPESEQKPEKPLAAKPVESQEETKRFRIPTAVEVPAEEVPVVEEAPAEEAPVVEDASVVEEAPAVEETVQEEPIEEEPIEEEPVAQEEQEGEEAHE